MSTEHTSPAAHTHTPWFVKAGSSNETDGAFYIKDSKGRTVTMLDSDSSILDEQYAALIVRSVNAFEPLRAALERCAELSASILDGSDMDKLDDWAEQARAALALAQLETK